MEAVALYDFEGNVAEGEINLKAGDRVRVLNQDIGEGWWEGEVNGSKGLFPASYVEMQSRGPSSGQLAPPSMNEDDDSDWGSDDDFDDDFDDDDFGDDHDDLNPTPVGGYSSQKQSYATTSDRFGRAGTLKRSYNRFSAFVKAGAEAFLIGAIKDITIDPNKMLHITEVNKALAWDGVPEDLGAISVVHDGSRSKFKGIKSYEAYIIEHKGVHVERRYKHFQWVHDRLVDKYSCICVPPLPGKDHLSKFGETFIDKRRQRLQMWLARISRHPVLSHDELALRHFLNCSSTDKSTWKDGKRRAEKDQTVGALFFKLISPDIECPRDSDNSIEQFGAFIRDMDKAVKRNSDIALAHSERMVSNFSKEYKKLSSGFEALGQVFANGGGQVNGDNVRLSGAFVSASGHISSIGDLWADQPTHDQIPLMDVLKEYHTMLPRFNDSITSSKSASLKVDEIENHEDAEPNEKLAVRSRCDVIHSVTLCEMAHFHDERRKDFRDMMTAYLEAKIKFHQQIIQKYQSALDAFTELGNM